MASPYSSESSFLKDYRGLTAEHRDKVDRFLKKLTQIQRAEQHLTAEIRSIEWKRREDERKGIHCSFCGKYVDDCVRVIAGPNEVYICDECARLCGQILDEEETKDAEECS